jgi:uncharacterized damage-inducible protein DinB
MSEQQKISLPMTRKKLHARRSETKENNEHIYIVQTIMAITNIVIHVAGFEVTYFHAIDKENSTEIIKGLQECFPDSSIKYVESANSKGILIDWSLEA